MDQLNTDIGNNKKDIEANDALILNNSDTIANHTTGISNNEMNITARSDNNKEMILMKELWEPTLHFERGLCYTFDPKLHGKFQADPDNLLSINITFAVSSAKGNFLIV